MQRSQKYTYADSEKVPEKVSKRMRSIGKIKTKIEGD